MRESKERHKRETRTICILEKWVRTGRLWSLWTGSTEGPSLTRLVSTWRAETIDGTANRCRLWYCHQTSRSRQNTRTPWRDFLNFKLIREQTQHHMTEEADGGFMRTCWVFSLLCTSSLCPRWGPAITACCALSFTFGSAVLLNAVSLQTGSLSPPARWRSPENRAPSPLSVLQEQSEDQSCSVNTRLWTEASIFTSYLMCESLYNEAAEDEDALIKVIMTR